MKSVFLGGVYRFVYRLRDPPLDMFLAASLTTPLKITAEAQFFVKFASTHLVTLWLCAHYCGV